MAQTTQDDRRTLAGCRGQRPTAGPAYLAERDGALGRGLLGRGGPSAWTSIANGLLALGVRKGDAFAILGIDEPRVVRCSTSRSACRRDRGAGLREQLAARLRVRDRPLGVGRRARRGRRPAREGRRPSRGAARGSATCSRSRDLAELEARGREFAAAHPDGARRARSPRSARTTSSPTSTPRARPARRRAA